MQFCADSSSFSVLICNFRLRQFRWFEKVNNRVNKFVTSRRSEEKALSKALGKALVNASNLFNAKETLIEQVQALDNAPNEVKAPQTLIEQVLSRWTTICSHRYHSMSVIALNLRFDRLKACGDVEPNPGPRLSTQQQLTTTLDPSPRKDEKPSIQVITYNVRGLGDKKKVRHLVNRCHQLCAKASNSIFMLQETFVEKLDLLSCIWRGEHHLTSGSGQGLGCITLLTAPFKILHRINLNERGHILVVTKSNIDKAELIVANIYAPNGLGNDKLNFFEEVIQNILELQSSYNCPTTILAGDFNLVFNANEAKNRLLTRQEIKFSNSVMGMLETAELEDGWVTAPKKQFTWSANRLGKQMFSTLDRVMYTKGNLKLKSKDVDWSLSLSDHAMVRATFDDPMSNRKGTNFIPRLDPRILDDEETCRIMDEEFRTMMSHALQTWDPHVALEYCKMSIRSSANAATGIMKAKYRDEEKDINENLNEIINELAETDRNNDHYKLLVHKLDDLRNLKRQLVDKIGTRIEQRNARTWYNEGELSNKYFFNLLNRKTNDEIGSIIINNEECTDGPRIESEIRDFYKNLYENERKDLECEESLFRHIDPIDPSGVRDVVTSPTLEELAVTLKSCADSAPGPDGISYSFLKHFWTTIGPLVVNAWDHSQLIGVLPPSHKQSYLRLIPKVGKDSRIISNLRPITLSNTDHKLITKTYARKLTNVVKDSIGQEQTAYLPNRLINDNIRAMLMTVDQANIDDMVDGVIVSLDAKKAFDSVSHEFIRRTLTAFGLGQFIPIFNVLYKDLRSDIILNGKVINGYTILNGVKQGDALSCILFIMCMEPLLRNIKNNQDIKRVRCRKLELEVPKAYGYADDVNVVTAADEKGIQEIFKEYEWFSRNSGLMLNADKTEIFRFRKRIPAVRTYKVDYMGKAYELATLSEVKINGIIFLQDEKKREERNLEKVLGAMTKHLKNWSRRHLTLLGKILILKTYAISQVIFLMQTILLNEKSLNQIKALVFKFLWNKNFNAAKAPDRIKRSIMLTPCKLGGFGLTDIDLLNKSLNLRAIGRLSNSEHPLFKQIWADLSRKGFFNVFTSKPVDTKLKIGLKLLNEQRSQVLTWPIGKILLNSSLIQAIGSTRLKDVLTRAGKLSLTGFQLMHNRPNVTLGILSQPQIDSVRRHLIHPELANIMRHINQPHLPARELIPSCEQYPGKDFTIKVLSSLSSKNLRENFINDEELIICDYRSGIILTPGEVLNWTANVKKLTSTKHRCCLLRIAHGDVYTNERQFRFGLSNDPKCANCDAPSENLKHRLVECPKAKEAWEIMERILVDLGYEGIGLTLEGVIGAGDESRTPKLALTLRSELTSRLMAKGGDNYCPKVMVEASLRSILTVEKLSAARATELRSQLDSLRAS